MGQFFKQITASCLGTLAGLTVFAGLGIGGLVVLLLSSLSGSDTGLKEKSVLVFDLSTSISDTPPSSTLADTLSTTSNDTLTLRKVIGAIEQAAEDPDIAGLLIYGRGTAGTYGYATLAEVREALEKFKETGKKIVAYDMNWTEKEYYLGSVADTVTINPVGSMEMNGLSSQQMFFADALKKYGVGVQVVRVGSFKGAVEPYIRQDLSPENRQQIRVLLEDIWLNYKTTIGESRKLTPAQIQTITDKKGLFKAKEAVDSRLVDRTAYFDQIIDEMRKLTGEKPPSNQGEDFRSFRQVSLKSYADTLQLDDSSANEIAIVYAEGTIVDGSGRTGEIGGDRFARELRRLQQEDRVKAVVIRINSPGGSATASDVILREINLLNKKKPVIISMGDVAASGGYWIATGGRRIFAENDTITGSIGVFGVLFNIQKIANDNGVAWDTVKTGQFADISSLTRPKTPAELAVYQSSVNEFYNLFIEKVATGRKLNPEKVRSIARGRVWTGKDAIPIGLVDEIGGLEAAVMYAAKTAKLGNDWSIREYPKGTTWEEELVSRLFGTYLGSVKGDNNPLQEKWRDLREELAKLSRFNDPRGVYAKLWLDPYLP